MFIKNINTLFISVLKNTNYGVDWKIYMKFSYVVSAFFFILYLSSNCVTVQLFIDPVTLSKWYLYLALTFSMGAIFSFNIRQDGAIDLLTLIVLISTIILLYVNIVMGRFLNIASPLGFLILYSISKTIAEKELQIIEQPIIPVCLIQSIYGLFQYFKIIDNFSNFRITGFFDNPAGFALCMVIGIPFCFFNNFRSKPLRYLSHIFGIIMILAVVLSESRTGVLCFAIEATLLVLVKIREYTRVKKFFYLSIIVTSIVLLTILLYKWKKDSAIGRGLIWHNTISMVENKTISGIGPGSFPAKYMLYQAFFFKQNLRSKFSLIADNINHPFNEFLLILVEYGIVGIFLVFSILVLTLNNAKITNPRFLSLLSILIFACFSYPLRYPFTWIALAVYIGISSRNKRILFKINKITFRVFTFLITTLGSYFLVKDIAFELQWKQISDRSIKGETELIIPFYKILLDNWNGNPYFLYNYAAELNYIGKYRESLLILLKCKKHLNDYDIQMLAADNYYNLNRLKDSEKCLKLASLMIPARFRPLEKLLEIYNKVGDRNNATRICKIIKCKQIKIDSEEIREIKLKADLFQTK